jgi:hypothetical protein
MAEITASFGGKNITITYPDELLGKPEKAFVSVNNAQWKTVVFDKKDELGVDSLTSEQESELKYEFTIQCILGYVKNVIKVYEIKSAVVDVEEAAIDSVDTALNQINVDIQ